MNECNQFTDNNVCLQEKRRQYDMSTAKELASDAMMVCLHYELATFESLSFLPRFAIVRANLCNSFTFMFVMSALHVDLHCRISPPRFLVECYNCLPYVLYCVGGDVKHCTIQSNYKRQLNQGNLFCCILHCLLFELYLVCVFSCTVLFVSISQAATPPSGLATLPSVGAVP